VERNMNSEKLLQEEGQVVKSYDSVLKERSSLSFFKMKEMENY